VWIFIRVRHRDVGQLNVEVLVNRMKGATNGEIILELYHHILAHQGLEK